MLLAVIYCSIPHKSSSLCGMLHPSMYDDAVCMNAVVEINMLDYKLQCRRTSRYGALAGNQALASVGFVMQRALCTLDSR